MSYNLNCHTTAMMQANYEHAKLHPLQFADFVARDIAACNARMLDIPVQVVRGADAEMLFNVVRDAISLAERTMYLFQEKLRATERRRP